MDKQKTIIIAEPDVTAASEIKLYLESLDYKVHPVLWDGRDLLDAAESLNPSLIITDINLHGQLDGIEAIARLESGNSIPYIFIVAYDDYSRLIESYYLNPICLLKKPVKYKELSAAILKAEEYMDSIAAGHLL
ncbi:MAG TPA: response regulator [Ignavibacteriaceae bacterium]|nr:response regulator [Ignavibacteriaceae bacterium]